MALRFKVEYVSNSRPTVIFVRQLQQQNFSMGGSPTLGGCHIRQALNQPRVLKKDGGHDLDVFAFHLVDGSDRSKFTVGDSVELIP